jgi:LCP family protein required for cell wall assembly
LPDSPARDRRPISAPLATFLSFLWPGAGQWYLGRQRTALIYAIPVALVFVAAIGQALAGLSDLAIQLFAPTYSLTILVLVVLLGLWRLMSMAGALTSTGRPVPARSRPVGVFVALAAVVVLVHGVAGYYAWSFYQAGTQIFGPSPDTVGVGPDPSASDDGTDDPSDQPSAEVVDTPGTSPSVGPSEAPTTADSRINILLMGVDSSSIRSHALTDTLIVASIDPVSGKIAMLSFPRDIARFPLWSGGTYTGKINSLMSYAAAHPQQFPDGSIKTLVKELGYLAGVRIDYYATVNLDGFRSVVDEVGGVDINNPRAINDPAYGGWTDKRPIGFYLSAGVHHLDGQTALAYVRSRKGTGDNDFTRARRQQQLLVALARKLADPSLLPRLPALLKAASDTVRTNFPADRLGEMLALGRSVPDDAIQRYVLGPPYAIRPPESIATYYLKIDFVRLAALSIKLFGSDSRYAPQPSPAPSPASSP